MFENLKIKRTIRPEEIHIKPKTTWTNIKIIAISALGSFLFGYSNNAISGTLVQQSFVSKYLSGDNAAALTDGILGGFIGGNLAGAIVQGPISTRYGRRIATAVAALLLTISGALQAGAANINMFIAARTICGIGAGMVITNVPVYMSEIAPPHSRGLLVASHGLMITNAYIASSAVALGFRFVYTDYQWRLQFVVLTFLSLLLLLSVFFLPESPRWLVQNDRIDEAWIVLEKLHKSDSDPEAALARAEFIQIEAQTAAEKELPKGLIYIFKTPSLRKRAFCAILVWMMGQSTGVLVIANLISTLFADLGYDTTLQLGLSLVWFVIGQTGSAVNAVLMDRFGRVVLLGMFIPAVFTHC